MDVIISIIILVVVIMILKYIFNVNVEKVKSLGNNEFLNKLTDKFPENIEICKKILRLIGNNNVKIEEEKDSKTSMYLVLSNKISIANLKGNYTRIQTIAHECIHSMQDRKILWSNFIISNVYLIYWIVAIVLTICGVFTNIMLQGFILLIISFVYYAVKSYLETDAMIKARYLAKTYMMTEKILKPDEIEEIVGQYDVLNKIGVKMVNYNLIFTSLLRILLYLIVGYVMINI